MMKYSYLNQPGVLSGEPTSEWTDERASSRLLRDWIPPSQRRTPKRDWTNSNFKMLEIPVQILEMVPESVARENTALPLSFDGTTLTFAVADETSIALHDKLMFILNCNIELVRGRRSDIEEAISRNYARVELESVDSMIQEFTETAIDFSEDELAEADYGHADAIACIGDVGPICPQTGRVREKLMTSGTRQRSFHNPRSDRVTAMFYHIVEEGDHVLMTRPSGTKELVVGPKTVWGWRNRFEMLQRSVAHPGEFLIVRFRDGTQKHLQGPAEIWFDPRVHESISCEDCLQISSKEAVVVYSGNQGGDTKAISRRILHGPALFVPQPGEWLHRFSWHASKGGHLGVEKQPNALVFEKLWLMPDQMYHDVRDVRTADNAVLTIRLMIFFELSDIERMLEETHDPIGDFVNAATADVVGFTGKHDFESFKQNTDELNDLSTYKTLMSRAQQIGYKINNVVYRGYGAADSLQKMHDQAIEARTRLQLDRATEEQTQDLENYRLESQLTRSAKRRSEQTDEVRHDIELNKEKQEADLKRQQAKHEFLRNQRKADAELQQEIAAKQYDQSNDNLTRLREMNVDLTAYLTQARADQVIEFRGESNSPHVHIDPTSVNHNGQEKTLRSE